MIVVLSTNEAPRLTDFDRLDRLHAELHGPLDAARLGELCQRSGDDHIWLDVARSRAAGVAATTDPDFGDGFDAMIEYASSREWLNEAGTHVRAHIVVAD